MEGAINWLAEHEGDPSLDEPLLVPKVRFYYWRRGSGQEGLPNGLMQQKACPKFVLSCFATRRHPR